MDLPETKGPIPTRSVSEGRRSLQNPSLTLRVGIKSASLHASGWDCDDTGQTLIHSKGGGISDMTNIQEKCQVACPTILLHIPLEMNA
jgi:hypothetical protein